MLLPTRPKLSVFLEADRNGQFSGKVTLSAYCQKVNGSEQFHEKEEFKFFDEFGYSEIVKYFVISRCYAVSEFIDLLPDFDYSALLNLEKAKFGTNVKKDRKKAIVAKSIEKAKEYKKADYLKFSEELYQNQFMLQAAKMNFQELKEEFNNLCLILLFGYREKSCINWNLFYEWFTCVTIQFSFSVTNSAIKYIVDPLVKNAQYNQKQVSDNGFSAIMQKVKNEITIDYLRMLTINNLAEVDNYCRVLKTGKNKGKFITVHRANSPLLPLMQKAANSDGFNILQHTMQKLLEIGLYYPIICPVDYLENWIDCDFWYASQSETDNRVSGRKPYFCNPLQVVYKSVRKEIKRHKGIISYTTGKTEFEAWLNDEDSMIFIEQEEKAFIEKGKEIRYSDNGEFYHYSHEAENIGKMTVEEKEEENQFSFDFSNSGTFYTYVVKCSFDEEFLIDAIPWLADNQKDLIKKRLNGETLSEIARDYCVSKQAVFKRLEKIRLQFTEKGFTKNFPIYCEPEEMRYCENYSD